MRFLPEGGRPAESFRVRRRQGWLLGVVDWLLGVVDWQGRSLALFSVTFISYLPVEKG